MGLGGGKNKKSMGFDESGFPESVKRYPGQIESYKTKEHENNAESLNDV